MNLPSQTNTLILRLSRDASDDLLSRHHSPPAPAITLRGEIDGEEIGAPASLPRLGGRDTGSESDREDAARVRDERYPPRRSWGRDDLGRGWWVSRLPRSLRLSCSEPSTQLAFLAVPWMPATRLSEPQDAKGHYPARHRPRGKRRRMRRRPAWGEVVQAGEPPAPRRAGSLVESRGKLGSEDRFLGLPGLSKRREMAGTNCRSRRGLVSSPSTYSHGGPSGGRRDTARSARRPPYDEMAATPPGPAGITPNRLAGPFARSSGVYPAIAGLHAGAYALVAAELRAVGR